VLAGTGGALGAVATVELAWALIFALARRVPQHDASVRSGGWQVELGSTLCGKTLGLVGLGHIGTGMVPVAKALGMTVTAWSRNLDPDRARAAGVEPRRRAEFFATADVFSVHIKLSTASRHYVGAAELALMHPAAMLVNTSRGPVVDTDALLGALRSGRLAGAALDVYDTEPLPLDHPLRREPNLVLTPHIGYVTRESYQQYFPQLVENVAAFLAGRPIRPLVPS